MQATQESKPSSFEVEKLAECQQLTSPVLKVIRIETQSQADQISETLVNIRLYRKEVFTHHEPMRIATYAAYQSVLDGRKRLDEPAEKAERIAVALIGAWTTECDRKAREEQRRQIEEQQRREAEELERNLEQAEAEGATPEEVTAMIQQSEMTPAPAPVVPSKSSFVGPGLSMRDNWVCENGIDPKTSLPYSDAQAIVLLARAIVEGKASPLLLEINRTSLNRMASAQRETFCVPGFRSVNKPIPTRKAMR